MIISIGFIRSAGQVLIQDLDWQQNSISNRLIDVTDLPEQNLQALFLENDEHLNSMVGLLEKEKNFYPILDGRDENLDFNTFEKLRPLDLKELYLKVSNRWTMQQNIKSLEQIYALTTHLRELWKKDRLAFFEETWYWLKRNLGTVELNIIFNDVIKSEEKDENNEKRERPKLVQSLLAGNKKANFQSGGPREKELMQNYLEKFHDVFEVTEYHSAKGQFVATAQIERSPMIFMARTPQLNQLQRSLLAGLFNGLQV
jgi:hypothetical protein